MLGRASRAGIASNTAVRRVHNSATARSSVLRTGALSGLKPAQRLPITPVSATTTTPSYSRQMSAHHGESTLRPEPDQVLKDIADYIHNYKIDSPLAFETARLCLIDTIGCGLEGLRFPECTKLLGPVVEGTIVPNGMDLHMYIRCLPNPSS